MQRATGKELEIVQPSSDVTESWIHAHLHRKEGGLNNAQYWYRHAGQPMCNTTLDEG